ncbi:MAG: T9SS type A sorting domain-containing protein, partial [Ignavibacteriales bacterium]|nr:T9SS type A sorting domain-containing protein [Ignavibacteriales bacterium]
WIGSDKIISYGSYIYICQDFWITILKNDLITSIDTDVVTLQKEFILYQNYPNPFNNGTKIKYHLPSFENVKIFIFDITGKLMQTINLGYQHRGDYEYGWTPENLSTGMYMIKLIVGNQTLVKKALLIK